MQTIIDLIERSFSLHTSRVAIRIYDNLWTYSDLQDLSNKISGFLLKSGIRKGDRVVVLMNKSIGLYAAMVGIMRDGGVYVPLDTRTPPERLARILEDLRPFRVFIDRHSLGHYQECDKMLNNQFKTIYLDDDGRSSYEKINFKEAPIKDVEKLGFPSSEDLVLILYTSGSTGVPKGAMISHGNLYNIIRYTIKAFHFGPGEVGSGFNANAFDMSITDTFYVLCSGGTLGVYPEEIIFPKEIVDLTRKYGITKMTLVPSFLGSLINSDLLQPESLKTLKDVFLGGELIPPSTLIKIMNVLPRTSFHNTYGPTETTNYVSKYTFHKTLNRRTKKFSIGFPIAGNRFILDRTGFENEKRKGELLIYGPQVGLGYWNDPEKTRRAFGIDQKGERFYRTGDIASLNPKVGYFIHGRKDDQVKFMGYRIELAEIEHILSLLPLVKENVVIPVYVGEKIEELRLIYSGDKGCDKEIRKHLRRYLPSYMIPKRIIHTESLPKNQNKKIDRALIKERYA